MGFGRPSPTRPGASADFARSFGGGTYATAHTFTLLMAILVFMPQSPSLRVLLIEDSALLAGRLIELVNRVPDVDLIDTVDTEADALDRISAGNPDVLILDLHLREG